MKLPVTIGCVVEVRNCFTERLRREVPQLILEAAERDGTLIEVQGGFRRLETETVLYEIIDPPVFAGIILSPGSSGFRGYQVQRAPWIGVSG